MPTKNPRFKVVHTRIEGGIKYETFEPVRKKDRIVDQVIGRALGYIGVGVAFTIGAILEKIESRKHRASDKKLISPF